MWKICLVVDPPDLSCLRVLQKKLIPCILKGNQGRTLLKNEIMKIDDYEEAYLLWSNTAGMGLRSLDDSKEGIRQFLKRNPTSCFVCPIEGILAGVILCGHDGRRGYIYHCVVHENFRKKGIGRGLVESVQNALDNEGIKKTALVVYADNKEGNSFWESLGFTTRPDLTYRNCVINESNI